MSTDRRETIITIPTSTIDIMEPKATPLIADSTLIQISDPPYPFSPVGQVHTYIMNQTHLITTKYCGTCGIWRTPRVHHCSVCNACIERQDHHCPWLGTCIGKHNYIFFCMYIWVLSILDVYLASIVIKGLVTLLVIDPNAFVAPLIVVAVISCLFAPNLVGLAGYHLFLVSNNLTTREHMDRGAVNPWNQGFVGNWKSFCGRDQAVYVLQS